MITNSSQVLIKVAAQRQAAHQRDAEHWRQAKLAEAARNNRGWSPRIDLKRAIASLRAASTFGLTLAASSPRP